MTYDFVVALMVRLKSTLGTVEARLKMKRKLSLTSTW
jgi:hypothetical protein